MAFRNLFVHVNVLKKSWDNTGPIDDFGFLGKLILTSLIKELRDIVTLFDNHNPNNIFSRLGVGCSIQNIFLAFDSPNCWRKDFLKPYKYNRRSKSKSFPIAWNALYKWFDDFKDLVNTSTPLQPLIVPECEADDIIAVGIQTRHMDLSIEEHNTVRIAIIIAGDKDYNQLLRYDDVIIKDPLHNKFRILLPTTNNLYARRCGSTLLHKIYPNKCNIVAAGTRDELNITVEHLLLQHILIGDKTDNISSIAKGVGPKRAEKLIESGEINDMLKSPEIKTKVEANTTLIDFRKIPAKFKEEIIKSYNNIEDIPAHRIDEIDFIHLEGRCGIFQLPTLLEDIWRFRPEARHRVGDIDV